MSMPGWSNGYADADLDDIPEYGGVDPVFGSVDLDYDPITMTGGLPYGGSVLDGGTYIIKRQGSRVLTPEGWFDEDEFEGHYG